VPRTEKNLPSPSKTFLASPKGRVPCEIFMLGKTSYLARDLSPKDSISESED
jgi:hypothetical protein